MVETRHAFPDGGDGPNFAVGVLGDLHLSPDRQMVLFDEARTQMRQCLGSLQHSLGGPKDCAVGLVQLGDLGGYHHQPGGVACFERAKDWLAGFGMPCTLITGNHDLGVRFVVHWV